MQLVLVARILGLFLIGYSASLLPPVLVSLIYDDGEVQHFLDSIVVSLICGLLLWWPGRKRQVNFRTRDGYLIVVAFWVAMSLVSAIPFVFSPHLPFVDALFEAISAFTTTGATVIVGLDELPRSVLYYRQQLQWLGGMGVVVLAVAIAPMLGVGGMQLYKAETPGPVKDSKLTPRITNTARALWAIYFGLTLACALSYWAAGMSLFDAIGHAMSTISTGGFSTHDASFGYFDSPLLEGIAVVFMLAGAVNFALHFRALHQRDPGYYWHSAEFRAFVLIVGLAIGLVSLSLLLTHYYDGPLQVLRQSVFQVVSVITSTGYGTDSFADWPLFLPVFLILISFIGGCGGSTAGGMKVMRWLLMFKQGGREIHSLVHPKAQNMIKVDRQPVPEPIINAVWGFFSVYMLTFGLLMLAMMATGVDQITAFSAIATSLNNLGPGLGEVASNFTSMNEGAIAISSIAMLLGRLEIFTVFVVLSPTFWHS